MNALIYLTLTRIKNSVRSFFRSPARIVLTVIMGALFATVLLGGAGPAEGARDIAELGAGILALYLLMFFSCAKSGLNNGASFFSMADVQLLFPAPLNPHRVLVYGLVRQLGVTFMVSLFVIYQYGWLHNVYGVGFGGLIGILLGYMLTVFCGQLAAMGIYAWSSGSERRKRVLRTLLYLMTLAVVAGSLYRVPFAQNKLAEAVAGANAEWTNLLPVVGWLRSFALGALCGNAAQMLWGLGLTAAFIALFALLVARLDADFYEDVLVAAETTQSAITAQKEGRAAESAPVRVRVGKTGLRGGKGASAFYFKHRVESRRSRVFLMDMVSLLFLAISCAVAWFTRDSGILPAFLFSLYMMIFGSFTGRWVRELTYPYVYLLPEKPFRKLLMLCAETIVKSAVESVLSMALIGWIVGAPLPLILCCAFTRWCFGLHFIACNVLTDRLFGRLPRAFQVIFFFLMLVLAAAPGAVAAVFAGIFAGLGVGICTAGLWMLAVSALILLLCRNILDNAELNN